MRRFYSAVVERNIQWSGEVATEPYEAGWATEAIAFVRILEGEGNFELRAQISPDGMRWCDEGTGLGEVNDDGIAFLRITHFGNWVRLAGHVDGETTVMVTWALKE